MFKCDWSSVVCSSDLNAAAGVVEIGFVLQISATPAAALAGLPLLVLETAPLDRRIGRAVSSQAALVGSFAGECVDYPPDNRDDGGPSAHPDSAPTSPARGVRTGRGAELSRP